MKKVIKGWGILDKKSKKFKYGGIGKKPKWFSDKKNEIEVPIKITYET